jgi:hypothetical protein
VIVKLLQAPLKSFGVYKHATFSSSHGYYSLQWLLAWIANKMHNAHRDCALSKFWACKEILLFTGALRMMCRV